MYDVYFCVDTISRNIYPNNLLKISNLQQKQ